MGDDHSNPSVRVVCEVQIPRNINGHSSDEGNFGTRCWSSIIPHVPPSKIPLYPRTRIGSDDTRTLGHHTNSVVTSV